MDHISPKSNKVTLGALKRQHRSLVRAHNKEVAKQSKLSKLMKDISYLQDRIHSLKNENEEVQKSLYHNGLHDTLRDVIERESDYSHAIPIKRPRKLDRDMEEASKYGV